MDTSLLFSALFLYLHLDQHEHHTVLLSALHLHQGMLDYYVYPAKNVTGHYCQIYCYKDYIHLVLFLSMIVLLDNFIYICS
jgi:hypothetical protein